MCDMTHSAYEEAKLALAAHPAPSQSPAAHSDLSRSEGAAHSAPFQSESDLESLEICVSQIFFNAYLQSRFRVTRNL